MAAIGPDGGGPAYPIPADIAGIDDGIGADGDDEEAESDIADGEELGSDDDVDDNFEELDVDNLVWAAESDPFVVPDCTVDQKVHLPAGVVFNKTVVPWRLFLALLRGNPDDPKSDIVALAVKYTNLHIVADWKTNAVHDPDDLQLTNESEIIRLFVCVLYMGMVKLPNRQMYFDVNEVFDNSFTRSMMDGKRFNQLISHLSFYDADMDEPKNAYARRTYKVKELMDAFNKNLKLFWTVGRDVSADEQTKLSKHHTHLQQYNANKPNKRHLKWWSIASSRGGLLWHANLYAGSERSKAERRAAEDAEALHEGAEPEQLKDREEDRMGLGERVIISLAKTLPGKHYHIRADNLFGSVRLADYLLRPTHGGHLVTMTMRPNRKGMQKELIIKKKDKGFHHHLSFGQITQHVWMDTKPVCGITTYFPSNDVATVTRRKKNGTSQEVDCPTMFKDYNEHMGGVDLVDYFEAVLGCHLRTRRWTNVVVWFVLNSMAAMTYNLTRAATHVNHSLNHLQTQWEIINGLANNHPEIDKSKKRKSEAPVATDKHLRSVEARRIDDVPHWICRWETKQGRPCVQCRIHGKKSSSVFKCMYCNISLHAECFEHWHTHGL
jgi:hypothetical protein